MKVWKKNLVAAAVLVTVCCGIYLNWLYTEDAATSTLTDTLDAEKVMGEDSLVLSEDMAALAAGEEVETTATDYFAALRISRQEARDNALNLLQEAMAYSTEEEFCFFTNNAKKFRFNLRTARKSVFGGKRRSGNNRKLEVCVREIQGRERRSR